MRQLNCRTTCERDTEDLSTTGLCAHEIDPPAIMREARFSIRGWIVGEPACRSPFGIDDPNLAMSVRRRMAEDNPVAVRRPAREIVVNPAKTGEWDGLRSVGVSHPNLYQARTAGVE